MCKKELCYAVMLIALAGCVAVPNRAYWTAEPDGTGDVIRPQSIEADLGPKFHENLAIVEFDEQGDYWSPDQIKVAMDIIKRHDTLPPLVVTYIHGWQNNAKKDNADLKSFNDLLEDLDGILGNERRIVGIYVGWQGEKFDNSGILGWVFNSIPRYLSFGDRKSATDRVAGLPLTALLAGITKAAREQHGRSVFIGHSFGARILERTIGKAMVAQYVFGNSEKILPPADLTLLINPASESYFGFLFKRATKDYDDRPIIIAVRSMSDKATGKYWSRGIEAISFMDRFRDYRLGEDDGKFLENQRTFFTQSIASDTRQITHYLEPMNIGTVQENVSDTEAPSDVALIDHSNSALLSNLRMNHSSRALWIETADKRLMKYELVSPEDSKNASISRRRIGFRIPSKAYWVIEVPDEVLKGHSGEPNEGGIFSRNAKNLVAALFAMSDVKANETPEVAITLPQDSFSEALIVKPPDANAVSPGAIGPDDDGIGPSGSTAPSDGVTVLDGDPETENDGSGVGAPMTPP